MSKNKNFKMSEAQRRRRRFSEGFKRLKVQEIEAGLTKVSEVSKQYEVRAQNVYRWIAKFGNQKKQEWLIVESQSDTKKLIALQKKVADLERTIGQKQLIIDFKDKMIELAEQEYGIDIKKNSSTPPSGASGKTDKKTPSK